MADPRIKDLKIKTGVVKRYVAIFVCFKVKDPENLLTEVSVIDYWTLKFRISKEKKAYERESVSQEEKVAKMEADSNTDPYMLKKQKEVLQEAKSMIPDAQRRLVKAVNDLKTVLVSYNGR